jgi:hypothetical protein
MSEKAAERYEETKNKGSETIDGKTAEPVYGLNETKVGRETETISAPKRKSDADKAKEGHPLDTDNRNGMVAPPEPEQDKPKLNDYKADEDNVVAEEKIEFNTSE